MKIVLEIPGALFRRAEAAAAERGISLSELVSDAIAENFARRRVPAKPWMRHFGKLRDLHRETVRINRIIEKEFGQIDPDLPIGRLS